MPPPTPTPPQKTLQGLFSYSPVVGDLFWLKGNWKGHPAGSHRGKHTYIRVAIAGKDYGAHRLIWTLVTGTDPGDLDVDHIDGDRHNNAWHNLRLATRSENLLNRGNQANNTSGHKGVDYHKARERWRARTTVGRRTHCLGYYTSFDEAVAAYQAAAERLHGPYLRLPE